jgi:membrane-associated protease RseP (regulator of RpoE activity)
VVAVAACGGKSGEDAGAGGSTTGDGGAPTAPVAGGGAGLATPASIDDLSQPSFNIVALGDDRYAVERDGLLQLIIDGMAGLITVEKQAKGYELTGVHEVSLANRLGIKAGDVFVSINAVKLERNSDLRRVHALLRTSGELHVVMERTGVSLKRRYVLAETLADKLPDPKLFPPRNAKDVDFPEYTALMDVIAKGVKRVSAFSYEIDKGVLVALADNPGFLETTQVAVPEGTMRRGRSDGVYIGPDRSVYSEIGFTRYDLIKKIGDKDITFSNELHMQLRGQRDAAAFTAMILRAGDPKTLEFKVVAGLVDKTVLGDALEAWKVENRKRRPDFDDPFGSPYSNPFPTRSGGGITKRSDYHVGVEAAGAQKYTIAKDTWAKIVANPTDAALDARIVPEYDDLYKFLGIKISGVRDDTLYKAAGFEDGDVVTAIDGTELKTPDDALEAAVKLEAVREFKVTFKRNGDEVTHTYTIK